MPVQPVRKGVELVANRRKTIVRGNLPAAQEGTTTAA